MEHLRFCGSLNIACGYAGEQGFCTLTRCPVVLDGIPAAMKRAQGERRKKGQPGQCPQCGAFVLAWDCRSDISRCSKCGGNNEERQSQK